MISLADSDRFAIRRAAARQWPKHGSGKRPMPAYVVAAMWADYERTRSLRQTGRNFQRTQQALSLLFRAHQLTRCWHAKPGPKVGRKINITRF